jgi:peptide/nickel transport system substrate-binding protein
LRTRAFIPAGLFRITAAQPGHNAPDESNELSVTVRTTLDEQVQYDSHQRMLDIWEDDAPGTVFYDPAGFYGASTSVN